jgi:hypothetical protein
MPVIILETLTPVIVLLFFAVLAFGPYIAGLIGKRK